MELFFWILLGVTAGWMSSIILETEETQGLITDIILGTTGAVVGGLILNLYGNGRLTGFSIYTIAIALLSAIVLIWIGRLISHGADVR